MKFKKLHLVLLAAIIPGVQAMGTEMSKNNNSIVEFTENGFKGTMVLPRRAWKPYNQSRTMHIIYGKGEKHSNATSIFELNSQPKNAQLIINGVDDSAVEKCNIAIIINDKIIYKGNSLFKNCTYTRGLTGRSEAYIEVPDGILKAGENKLELKNLSSCLDKNRLPWIAFDKLAISSDNKISIKVKTKCSVAWGLEPLTVCLFPSYFLDNTVTCSAGQLAPCYINVRTGAGIEEYYGKPYSVFFKLPVKVKLEEVTKGAKIINNGNGIWEVKMAKITKRPEGFLLRKSQQMVLVEAPGKPGEIIPFETWIGFPGDSEKYWVKEYKLNIVEAIKPRKRKTPFNLNTWVRIWLLPKSPAAQKKVADMLKNLGVTSNWCGNNPAEIKFLNKHGINAIIQRNWYQHDRNIIKADKDAQAYGADGKPDKRGFVRPYYQYNRGKEFDQKILGGWRKDAAMKEAWACGTDFEGLREDMSLDPETIKQFNKISGIKETDPKKIIDNYYPEWIRFRGWESSQIMRVANEEVKKVDPNKKWVVFSDGGDLSTYWWHKPIPTNTKAIAKYADMMCTSLYYYDNAGAIKTIQPFSQMLFKAMPVEKAAPCLIFAVYPIENEYFGFLKQPVWSVRQSTILLALNGMQQVSWFAGIHMDGIYLDALSKALQFIDKYYHIVEKGEMLNELVDVKLKQDNLPDDKAFFDVSGTPYFYDACRWMPDKQFWFTKVVWFYRDSRYVFLANHTSADLEFDIKATAYTGRKWHVSQHETEERDIGELDLKDNMWSKPFTVKVPKHKITVIKMKRIK